MNHIYLHKFNNISKTGSGINLRIDTLHADLTRGRSDPPSRLHSRPLFEVQILPFAPLEL